MRKKIVWLVVACMMALSLVMASCGGAETTTEEEEAAVAVEEGEVTVTTEGGQAAVEEEEEEEVVVSSEEPQYGGWVVIGSADIIDFDEIIGFGAAPGSVVHQTQEELSTGDWAKGPAGTNETDWASGGINRWDLKDGAIADSWDFSEPGVLKFHIREGNRYALNTDQAASRMVGGRYVTVEDCVFSLRQIIDSPRSFVHSMRPELWEADIYDDGSGTLVIELVGPEDVPGALEVLADFTSIIPPEVVETYGNMTDWRNNVGSGPFILKDFVPGSQATFERNPTYWRTNPCGPGEGDELPYADGLKMLILLDPSTTEAAFRTGQIDLGRATWETFPRLHAELSECLYSSSTFDGGFNCHFNTQGELYSDKNLRRAMMMATDFDTIVNELMGGDAMVNVWPITYNPAYGGAYLFIEEAPASVQELYTYNPTKAMELMALAGKPNGFTTTVICSSDAYQVDFYSILADQWEAVNVELLIDPKEGGTWTSIYRSGNYEELCHCSMSGMGDTYSGFNYNGAGFANASKVDEPYIQQMLDSAKVAIIDQMNESAADAIIKELMAFVLDQAYAIPYPKAPGYRMWWPWIKNYNGEWSMGNWNADNWVQYVWVDEDLKDTMGY